MAGTLGAAVKRSLNLGVLGVDNRIGAEVARNLAFKSRNAVYLQLYDANKTAASRLADELGQDGAQCAMRLHHRLATVTKWCDVVTSCINAGDHARFVLLESEEALVRNARRGQIIVDHAPVDMETARECAHEARRRGAWYLDAPLAGTALDAKNGQLTVMVGGDEEAYMKVLAMLRLYGENVHYMGATGSGTAAKAVSASLAAMHAVAAAEAVSIAHDMGVENMDKLLSVLDASDGASAMLRMLGPKMVKLTRNPETIPEPHPVNPDRLLDEVSHAGGASTPLLREARGILARTAAAGIGDRDAAAVVHFLHSVDAGGPPVPMDLAVAAEDAHAAEVGRAAAPGDAQPEEFY